MKKTSYFSVLSAAILWGTIGFFVKGLYNLGFDSLQIIFIRATYSSILLGTFLLFTNKSHLKIEFGDIKYFIGTGILSFAFFNWCYFTAINITSLSIAAILLYTAPAFVMIFSVILFKEKLTILKVISLILTFTGCMLVTGYFQVSASDVSAMGIIAGLGSGLGYALYSIFGNYAIKKYDSLTITTYTFIFAIVGLIPVTNVKGIPGLFNSIDAVYYSIGIGVFTTVLPYLLYTKGIAHIEISRASIIATIEPVIATVIGVFFFKESVSLYKMLGVVLVIIAVAIIRDKD